MPDIFQGSIPDDRLYDPQFDMWVQRDGDTLTIGMTSFGAFLAGEIIAFTGKPKGAVVARGRGLGTVESAKTVLAVHAPCGVMLTEVNEALEERPAPLNRDACSHFLVRGTATDWAADAAYLIDGEAYRAHVLAIEPEAGFT